MEIFNRLVSEQMKTMDKLLFLQTELERCQEIEEELIRIQKITTLQSVQDDIRKMKQELSEIHRIFEMQTEDVIRTYQDISVKLG